MNVAITGRGLVCALGDQPAAVHGALCDGRSGLGPVELFDVSGLVRPVAGEVRNFAPKAWLGARNLRPLDRTGRLLAVAAHLTLADAGLAAADRAEEVGLVLGTVYGSVGTIAEFDHRAQRAGPRYASPMDFPNTVINAAAGQAAIWHGLRGLNLTLSCGTSSGLRAIAVAAELIASGRADALLAGGAEELAFPSFLALERAGLLDTSDADPVPFDPEARGFLPGEGAGLLLLESSTLATRRGVPVLATVRGAGSAFDPSLGRDGAGARRAAARALRQALDSSGVAADRIGGLLVSAAGGPGDASQAEALVDALGGRAAALPVAAPKASLGETLGADGGLQAVLAVESLVRGTLPGIRGFGPPRPGFALAQAQEGSAALQSHVLLLASSGWDGHHAALVIAATEPTR